MENLELDGFAELPGVIGSGVYALCWNNEVLYVGKAVRVLHRIYQHRTAWERMRQGQVSGRGLKGILFNRVFVRPCREVDLDRVEREMIVAHKPKHNSLMLRPSEKVSLTAAGFDMTLLIPKGSDLVRRI